ncbi:MAG TPA: RNA polymerase sigma factor [Kofleriaceae bacterium]|nr:RNA polymerase sigma factor [Kofleriaceae bacterium]
MKLAVVSSDVKQDEDDSELIARMAGGDRDALGTLFDRHHQGLYSFLARAYGGRDVDVDDLVQSTFIEAFRAAQRYRGASSPRSWLFAIGGNVAKMHRRATMRRYRALQSFAGRPEDVEAAPDDRVSGQRALARIEEALDGMAHELRLAYVMCVIEGVAGDDAARALGIARGTLWRRTWQARQILRAAVDPDDVP